jgi:hypothetical protein
MTQDDDLLALAAKRRRILGLALLLALGAIFGGFYVYFRMPQLGNLPIYIILAGWVPYYATIAFVWKCPKCDGRIGNQPAAKVCPKCDFKLLAD